VTATTIATPAPIASAELVTEVLGALIDARDAKTPHARRAAYDRLGAQRPFLEWLAERDRRGALAIDCYPRVPKNQRDRGVNAATEQEVFTRDHYRCQWCGLPVVTRATLRAHGLSSGSGDPPLGPDGLRTLGGENTTHVVLFGLAAVADHIKPWSAGGPSTLDNLVTSCNPCNARVRGSATLECVGFERRTFDPLPGWPR
jgi:hypothetical protein